MKMGLAAAAALCVCAPAQAAVVLSGTSNGSLNQSFDPGIGAGLYNITATFSRPVTGVAVGFLVTVDYHFTTFEGEDRGGYDINPLFAFENSGPTTSFSFAHRNRNGYSQRYGVWDGETIFRTGLWSYDDAAFGFTSDGPVDYQLTITQVSSAVPEPVTWAMMIAGFGLVGAALRRSRRLHRPALA